MPLLSVFRLRKKQELLSARAQAGARVGFDKTFEYAVYILCGVTVGALSVVMEDILSLASAHSQSWFHISPYLSFAVVPASFWVAANLVHRFAPFAGGSGIPQVKRAVSESLEPGVPEKRFLELCSLKTAAIKIISGSVAIFGGASLGREGPMAQISAGVFQHINLLARRFGHQFRFESVLSAGAAAGIAAAFNTPLGGITFALEELAEKGFGRVKQLVILAIIVAGMTAQALTGNHLFFGRWVRVELPELLQSMASSVFVGAVCGVFGVLFCKIVLQIRSRVASARAAVKRHMLPLGCGLIVATLGVVSQGHSFGTGYDTTRAILEQPGAYLEIWFPLAKFVSTLVSFVSGVAGGIFAPSLAVGAATGNVLGLLFPSVHSVLYTLLGMTAWLSAITQAPLTAVIIVMEMTETHEAVIPLMLASFSAFAVARGLMPHSLYDQLARSLTINVTQPSAVQPAPGEQRQVDREPGGHTPPS